MRLKGVGAPRHALVVPHAVLELTAPYARLGLGALAGARGLVVARAACGRGGARVALGAPHTVGLLLARFARVLIDGAIKARAGQLAEPVALVVAVARQTHLLFGAPEAFVEAGLALGARGMGLAGAALAVENAGLVGRVETEGGASVGGIDGHAFPHSPRQTPAARLARGHAFAARRLGGTAAGRVGTHLVRAVKPRVGLASGDESGREKQREAKRKKKRRKKLLFFLLRLRGE